MPNRHPTVVDLPVLVFIDDEPCIIFPVEEFDEQDPRSGRHWHEDCDLKQTQPLPAFTEE